MAKPLLSWRKVNPWWGRLLLAMGLGLVVVGVPLHWFDGWRVVVMAWLHATGMLGFFGFSVAYNVLLVPFPYDPFLWMMAAGQGADRLGWWACATLALTLAAGIAGGSSGAASTA